MDYITRLVEKDFLNWKNNMPDYGLEVTGCRQVGKTTAVLHFAQQNYKYVIYVNVGADTDIRLLEDADTNTVVTKLKIYCEKIGIHYVDTRDTVLIFDEIQESRKLYERIRIFNRYLKCDLIVTGSNLAKTKDFFQPAGDVIQIRMYPLSFEEYINYYGAYDYYTSSSIDQICTEKYDWFHQVYTTYLTVGGYPAVFNAYLEGRSLQPVFEDLLETFKSEFRVNTGNPADYDKIELMFGTICKMLCREKKGDSHIVEQLSKLTAQNKSKRIATEECNNLLAWLSASRIINYCDKIDLRTKELYPSERFYFEDVGIFQYLCDKYRIDSTATRGLLVETFIFKQLKENHFVERFYMDRPAFAVNESYELDFYVVSRIDDKAYGIEAKAGKNAGISIRKMLDHKQLDYAVYARSTGKAGQDENVYTIPTFLLNKFSFDKGTPIKREPLKKIEAFHP